MPQYDAKKIVHNIEDMIEDRGGERSPLPPRGERGGHRDATPREVRQSVSKMMDKNALNRMREIKNVDRMVSSAGPGFLTKFINRIYRLFTRPQAEYNDLNIEALTIVGSALEVIREQITRLEDRGEAGFSVSGEYAADFRRLTALVTDHLREIYSNAGTIHRDIESVTKSMSHMLDHLKRIGEEMNGLTLNQKDMNGQISAARLDASNIWSELDKAYEILDDRANDIWHGLEERDRQISKNAEAAHAVSEVSREIKARLLVISEQISHHQEMLENLHGALSPNGERSIPTAAVPSVPADASVLRPRPGGPAATPNGPDAATLEMSNQLMGLAYTRFQRQFRADDEELLLRQKPYVELLQQHHSEGSIAQEKPRLLDIACGDGIFLQAIQNVGWDCAGVDLNKTMVNHGKSLGRPVELAEAFEYLRNATEKSFTVVTAFQFIEHLTGNELMEFAALTYRVLKPGGLLLTETINPHTLMSFRWFHMDLTHARLVYPEVLQIIEETAGFQLVESKEVNPVEGNFMLQAEGNSIEAKNARKLNSLLFGNQDYYMLSRKP